MKKCICILLALILALCASAASAESAGEGTGPESRDYEHATVGNPTKLDGCFFTGMWGNITSDVDIRDLVAGYNLVKWDGGFSQYRFDHSVVSGAVAGTDRDGNRRYEIVLCDDLYFSDGTPVTARDYAFSILLQCSPLISDLGGHPEKHDYLLGYEEYSTGKSGKLAGVRVISDRQLTLIVVHAETGNKVTGACGYKVQLHQVSSGKVGVGLQQCVLIVLVQGSHGTGGTGKAYIAPRAAHRITDGGCQLHAAAATGQYAADVVGRYIRQ